MKNDIILRGIAASPGIAIGPAFIYEDNGIYSSRFDKRVDDIEKESNRFKKAIEKSKKELAGIKRNLTKKLGFAKANFLDAQLLVLEDQWFIDKVSDKIRKEKKNAAGAVLEINRELLTKFREINNPYLKERLSDIKDVTKRVIKNLSKGEERRINLPQKMIILVAENLSPSDTAQLEKETVLAFLTDLGGKTSHTAIMARALEIPAVVGLREITKNIYPGVKIIVDGYVGIVVVNPTEKFLRNYEKKKIHLLNIEKELLGLNELSATTVDGHTVDLSANIEFTKDIESAKKHGAKDIGLYRTEFLYLTQNGLPDEELEYKTYKEVVDKIYPETVIFRTLDIGGDKLFTDIPEELNPFLGWRAIRFFLIKQDIFRKQLEAILKASYRKNVRIMFPMMTDIEELRKAKKILREVADKLEKKGLDFDRKIEIGIMVEVPSCAILANEFAKETDFFSIGTNDLTQYLLAVDRTNEYVASLYDHLHPAVLRTIKTIVDAAHRNRKWVGICGEMAGDPLAIPILLGLGIDELSATPIVIPEVKKVIRTLSMKESKKIAKKCLAFSTAKEVRNFLKEIINTKLPIIRELIFGGIEN